ncbi:MAG TPA: arsenite methyltransferase [Solirubrobacterales bacterium]|nr:arsenite methyltransferase [Solirubrobacterales bacterium]
MAELEQTTDCCAPEAQATCCEPEAKSDCCGDGSECGCSDGNERSESDLKEIVRERYAAAAVDADSRDASCCANDAVITEEQRAVFGSNLYLDEDRSELPEAAQLASLGCGNPTAIADLQEGQTVLDLGSGGGIDVLLSARRVGPTGKAFGLDMTDEMLELARSNQKEAGVDNVEFLKGEIEAIPLPDDSIDVLISNCVINLSGDKPKVLQEAARVLRPGGRFAVSDVIADPEMTEETRTDMKQWTGCIAGALTRDEFEAGLLAAGFESVQIEETHRVHDQASSAIVRATMPS